jgi:hypothetical protein
MYIMVLRPELAQQQNKGQIRNKRLISGLIFLRISIYIYIQVELTLPTNYVKFASSLCGYTQEEGIRLRA